MRPEVKSNRFEILLSLQILLQFIVSSLEFFIYLFNLFKVGTILVVTNKNQPAI